MEFKTKIRLDTMSDIQNFVNITSQFPGKIVIQDKDCNYRVNAKSLIGVIASMEWGELWCYSEEDIYTKISAYAI